MNEELKLVSDGIQNILNKCISHAYNALADNICLKSEYFNHEQMIALERQEYIRVSDELLQLYMRFSILKNISNYYDASDFLWESNFYENMTPEEKRKYIGYRFLSFNYSAYEQDNTAYDEELPYFSGIIKTVVFEKYLAYLRDKRNTELDVVVSSEPVPVVIEKMPIPTAETNNPFEQNFISVQLNLLAECANEVKMFNAVVTPEDWKAIFDCKPNTILKSKNNRLLAYFFSGLSNRSLITENWQSVIAKYKLFLASQKNDYLNCNDLANANANNKDVQLSYKYTVIDKYIKQLQKPLG